MPDMMKKALVVIADGSEEMEAVITIDVLRRGGVEVTVAGLLSGDPVRCARKTKIVPDTSLEAVHGQEFDVVILPGGQPGSDSFAKSEAVGSLLRSQFAAGRMIAAICAAPIALQSHGIAKGIQLTSHPSVEKRLLDAGYQYSEDRVVVSGTVVTSRGPGTAFEFALKLVELLMGGEKANEIQPPMMMK